MRVRIVLALVVGVLAAAVARGEEGEAARQLRRECDELLARVVKRPYGWAWAEGEPEAKPKGGAQVVTMRPGGSAAAGLVLYWAGELLDEPRYKEAAYQAARGVSAAERPTGMVPAQPTFLPNVAGERATATLVADRAPTCAGEALLLTITEEAGEREPMIAGAARRGVNWLLKQQTVNGSWPQQDPPTTQPSDAVKFIRLDDGEWRNCVFAMLLAHDVLNDRRCADSVERSNARLLRMRIGEASVSAAPLWATAYGMEGFASNRVPGFPPGVDMLATRRAMEALLGTVVVMGDPPRVGEEKPTPSKGLSEAAEALGKLPKFDGGWLRLYEFDVEATRPPPPKTPVGFDTEPMARLPRQQTGDWGLGALVDDTAVLKEKGRGELGQRLAATLPAHQRLAVVMCGLEDEPFGAKADASPTAGTPPQDLGERVRRAWQALLQARRERK